MKAAICDDSPEALRELSDAVRSWGKTQRRAVTVERFSSAEQFLFRYEECRDFDVVLLDIEMPGENGVELAKKIRRENDRIQIVFITGYPDFIAEGYEVGALHYLMKPVSRQKLGEVLSRAAEKLQREEPSVLFQAEGTLRRVPVSQIVLAEAFAHDCAVTAADGVFTVRESISAVEKRLCEAELGGFVRTHRSYLVGLRYVQSIEKTEVTLDGGRRVPLSRGSVQAVRRAFLNWYRGELEWD